MENQKKLSIVIPVYNEAKTIHEILDRVLQVDLNYGFEKEADQLTLTILEGAEGLLDKGTSIRENYHPVTGEGLNAHNFSWSAAHIIMLLVKE